MSKGFALQLYKDDIEGTLKEVIDKLTVLAKHYGEDKTLEVEIATQDDETEKYISVRLRG
jgi:hypothetical protein